MMRSSRLIASLAAAASLWAVTPAAAQSPAVQPKEILNVSYDIARELYVQLNAAFIPVWQAKSGQAIEVKQSHGGSSRQARAILEGLKADVVTFNQVTDVQILHDRGKLIGADWQKQFPNASSPYYSLPAFLVRAGNPKGVKDWDDLVRPDVKLVFPNPKTSGNARYTYLAAYAFALEKSGGNEATAKDFVKKLLANVAVFDTGGRAATTTFVEREIGDVLITFEAEVNGIRREYGLEKFRTIVPPASLLAEFPVAIVDAVVDQRGSRTVAKAYLDFLYSPQAQEILAANYNRVHDADVVQRHAADFPAVRLWKVEEVFGDWDKIQRVHFAEGGIFDQVFTRR
jgi:sulfate transport system substrate-binding protein